MQKTTLLFLLILLMPLWASAQSDNAEKDGIRYHIFLPALELGYVDYGSENLSGGIIVKTAIEYRLKTKNALFFRINYDNRKADYSLNPTGLNNIIEGKVQFDDLIGGLGYRFGKNKLQFVALLQGGVSFYNFPNFELNNNVLSLRNRNKNVPISRATLGLEYYLDANSAITLEVFQSQFWNKEDFWQNNQGSWGIALGVTATLY